MQTEPKNNYMGWETRDEDELIKIMVTARRGEVYTKLREAAKKLHRTFKSCANRWGKLKERDDVAELLRVTYAQRNASVTE
jgi:hypothetical protein